MNVRLLAAAALLLAAACLGAQNLVHVTDAQELVQAIGSDRTVILAPGDYLLSEVAQISNPAVSWKQDSSGGPRLVIRKVSNLTLRAEQASATLQISSRSACTLAFDDCRNLALENLTILHPQASIGLSSKALRFDACEGVRVAGCDISGGGALGIYAQGCIGILVRASIIRNCASGAFWASEAQDLRLELTTLTGNECSPLLSFSDCRSVVLDSCRIEKNAGDWVLLFVEGAPGQVSLPRTEITRNLAESLLLEGSPLDSEEGYGEPEMQPEQAPED